MQERIRFIADLNSGLYTMTELCERYGISRKTGYKWQDRFEGAGVTGLSERSHVPKHCPHRMAPRLRRALLIARLRHPTWGPRKLLGWLTRRWPDTSWPAPSTVGDLLRREGLIVPRRRRRPQSPHPGRPRISVAAPNDLWTADFKGQFRLRNQDYCYPLTILDHHSRYSLGVQALPTTESSAVRPVFDRLFRDLGLPRAIQTDNGTPFVAPRGLQGLSDLSVWWIRLGIRPLRIQPGKPQQNGAHERFHRTLKSETTQPLATSERVQQRRFDHFREVYNHQRPHEALHQQTPASAWAPSPRPLPRQLPEPAYPSHHEVRIASETGAIVVHHRPIHLTSALRGQSVGLEEIDDGVWTVRFFHVELGRYHERNHKLYPGECHPSSRSTCHP